MMRKKLLKAYAYSTSGCYSPEQIKWHAATPAYSIEVCLNRTLRLAEIQKSSGFHELHFAD
jgi:hypothetical protein